MNGGKRIRFQVRKPALGLAAQALYILGGLGINQLTHRYAAVPVAVAYVAVYVAAFVAVPALLRRRKGPEQAREKAGAPGGNSPRDPGQPVPPGCPSPAPGQHASRREEPA